MYLFAGTPVDNLTQGFQVPLYATFVGPDGPLTGAVVSATVQSPNNMVQTLLLHDDGNHNDMEADDGVYANVYKATSAGDIGAGSPPEGEEPKIEGSYQVYAIGVKGDLRREAQTSFAIERGEDANQNRLPDAWEKLYGVDNPDEDTDRDGLSNFCEF